MSLCIKRCQIFMKFISLWSLLCHVKEISHKDFWNSDSRILKKIEKHLGVTKLRISSFAQTCFDFKPSNYVHLKALFHHIQASYELVHRPLTNFQQPQTHESPKHPSKTCLNHHLIIPKHDLYIIFLTCNHLSILEHRNEHYKSTHEIRPSDMLGSKQHTKTWLKLNDQCNQLFWFDFWLILALIAHDRIYFQYETMLLHQMKIEIDLLDKNYYWVFLY